MQPDEVWSITNTVAGQVVRKTLWWYLKSARPWWYMYQTGPGPDAIHPEVSQTPAMPCCNAFFPQKGSRRDPIVPPAGNA